MTGFSKKAAIEAIRLESEYGNENAYNNVCNELRQLHKLLYGRNWYDYSRTSFLYEVLLALLYLRYGK